MKADEKKCPRCAEVIKLEAVVCRHCGHEFDEAAVAQQVNAMWNRKLIGAGVVVAGLLLLTSTCESGDEAPRPASTTASAAQSVDPAECEKLISDAERAGLVRQRPAPNRVDVEDRLWANFPAASKNGLALSLLCSSTGGREAEIGDYAVVYGYRSGKRLAMATSVGVNFD